jgi:PE-PPE domain/PE family
MTQVVATPEALLSTAAKVEEIGAAINAANAAAAGPTTGLASAAQDEVSAAIAKLFGAYGEEYQTLVRQVAAFHSEFTQAIATAGTAYAEAEAVNAGAVTNLLGPLGSPPIQTLLGGAPTGAVGATGPTVRTLLASSTQVALVMGGTSNPDPDPGYLGSVAQSYLLPRFPQLQSSNVFPQTTPEQFWPVTSSLGNMTFGQSVTQGVGLLDTAIKAQISQGNSVAVFGYSQSATIATDEIRALMAMGSGAPAPDQLAFVLVGDPNNPNGGILERFPGFYIPSLDVAFNGATPPNSPYPTSIYTVQYDGIANAPQYPLNVVSDLNAIMGYFYVHSSYPSLSPTDVANAVQLPTSPGYTGSTDYYMVMTQDLPLLEPIRSIPYVGAPIADLLQPDLRVLVDMGYSSYGPGASYADIPTPAGLFSVGNPLVIIPDLAKGAVQGVQAAGVDAGLLSPSLLPNAYPYLPSVDPGLNFYLGQPSVTLLSTLSGDLGNVLELIPPIT